MKRKKNAKKLPTNVMNNVTNCEVSSRKAFFLQLSKYNDN